MAGGSFANAFAALAVDSGGEEESTAARSKRRAGKKKSRAAAHRWRGRPALQPPPCCARLAAGRQVHPSWAFPLRRAQQALLGAAEQPAPAPGQHQPQQQQRQQEEQVRVGGAGCLPPSATAAAMLSPSHTKARIPKAACGLLPPRRQRRHQRQGNCHSRRWRLRRLRQQPRTTTRSARLGQRQGHPSWAARMATLRPPSSASSWRTRTLWWARAVSGPRCAALGCMAGLHRLAAHPKAKRRGARPLQRPVS